MMILRRNGPHKYYHQRSCYRQQTSGENKRQRTEENVDL